LPAATRAITFELDHPETSRAKQAALKKHGPLPERVRFITLDFNHQAVDAVLTQAGFDKTQPACFVWEGVTNYLTSEAIDSVLRQIQQAAPGSILLVTYIDRAVLDHPERFFGAAKLMARLESYGEPWTFGYSPEALSTFLAARGFQLLSNRSVADVWRQAGRPNSGTRGYEFYWLASARIA
jgi:methyltransferase (TIGR00027 family)